MDPAAFDTIARAIAQSGTRRRLVALLATLPLGGLLTDLAWDEVAAQRPTDRVQQRTQQRNRNQRNKNKNNNNNNKKNNNKNNPKNSGGTPRLGAGTACRTAADCASGACCQGSCCQPPANQCNQISGLCCAPNCAGRQCGPDGCGNAGRCGSCPPCQTCNELTGQCSPVANGTPCGSQPGGGTTRCCNGSCPTPTCLPFGTKLPDIACFTVACPSKNFPQCCSNESACSCNGETCECECYYGDPSCGSDADCFHTTPACICGTCQASPS